MPSDPPRVEHDFELKKLAYGAGQDEIIPNRQGYWRISLFFNRKEGISPEYFARHWHHVHGDIVTRCNGYFKNKILRYNQFRM
jgi:hypothetical protein